VKLLVFLSILLGFITDVQKIHIFSQTKVGKDTVRRDECKHCVCVREGGRGISNQHFEIDAGSSATAWMREQEPEKTTTIKSIAIELLCDGFTGCYTFLRSHMNKGQP